MKNQILSCEFNIDTACVEFKLIDGSMVSIDCIAVENKYANNMYEVSELDYLIYWAKQAEINEEKLLKKLVNDSSLNQKNILKNKTAELAKTKKRKAEVDRLFAKMYEDWANERITEYNFNMMSVKYQAEQEELDERTETLQAEIAAEEKVTCNAEKWIELIKQYSNPTEMTAEMLNTLIERIDIHEAKVNDFGEKEQIINIYYRFVGKID